MDKYRGRYRPVAISAPSADSEELQRQRSLFASAGEGMRERDIVLIEAVGQRITTLVGPDCDCSAKDLRAQYGIDAARFSVVLVGKDGGVKLRAEEAVPAEELFALIDSMPMRQREMRESKRR